MFDAYSLAAEEQDNSTNTVVTNEIEKQRLVVAT